MYIYILPLLSVFPQHANEPKKNRQKQNKRETAAEAAAEFPSSVGQVKEGGERGEKGGGSGGGGGEEEKEEEEYE